MQSYAAKQVVQGYALDALEVPATPEPATPSLDDARDFLALLLSGYTVRDANVGMGRPCASPSAASQAPPSPVDDELVTLTAFAHEDDDPASGSGPRAGRIRRPPRRAAG